jgi:hypothetical protein
MPATTAQVVDANTPAATATTPTLATLVQEHPVTIPADNVMKREHVTMVPTGHATGAATKITLGAYPNFVVQ